MSFALAGHLVSVMALLRPAAPDVVVTPVQESYQTALKLRFIPLLRPASTFAPLPSSSVVVREVSAKESLAHQTKPTVRIAAESHEADAISPVPPDTAQLPAMNQQTNSPPSTGDGGFKDRMFDAQQSPGIHGVPGSDRRIVSGIELANPMDQGVGSVLRNAKRLFGVTDRHCIDVDVWRHMSEDELIQRHLTSAEVEKESEKYNCNRPLGLNF